jgi:hypothetical protein
MVLFEASVRFDAQLKNRVLRTPQPHGGRPKMLNLEVKTKLRQEEAVSRVKKFFGKGGLGLDLSEENQQCLSFQGGGGYVTATICSEGDKTRIDLVTQEWDIQVKEFASRLP